MIRRGKLVCLALVALAAASFPLVAHAVRANWGVRQQGPRLEELGRHEEAAYCYRAALDFYTVIQQLWADAVYDARVDGIYRDYVKAFGTDKGYRGAGHEEWQDTAEPCLLFYNRDGAARNVEKGKLSPRQRARLEDRVRIYIEDLMDPDHGFGGDFSFSRKAWLLERTGLFWHAAFRRELAGRYAIQVCSRYCAATADEMERVFHDPARARLYRQKAAWWRSRGLDELQLCNGDRALARVKSGGRLKRLARREVIAVLGKGLLEPNQDARRAAVRILADLGELELLKRAMGDVDAETRKHAEAVLAAKTPQPTPEPRLQPGAVVEYFSHPAQKRPLASKVFETVDIGMKLQANFRRAWYDYWDKPEIFPADAQGPFRLRITGKLSVPADGRYRFYVKTEVPHRAVMSIKAAPGVPTELISPRNDRELQYVLQVGMPTHRIDFSEPVPLKKGVARFAILYTGNEVRKTHNEHMVRISGVQKAGIQLFWSSDRHLTELVPARALFHDAE